MKNMPTPFTHINAAQRLIDDPALVSEHRDFLASHWGPFLLGNVAPDGHHGTGSEREDTHFFIYQPRVDPPATQAMLDEYPLLQKSNLGDSAQAAFVAGYLAHIAMDVVWCEDMLFTYFHGGDWGSQEERFFMLHVILAFMDQRDYQHLTPQHQAALASALPDNWLPFFPDEALVNWRDIVAGQIPPAGSSRTVEILGRRVSQGIQELASVLESPARLNAELWANVPREALAQVEATMYQRMFEIVTTYLEKESD
jgi:hypothetical protein